MISLVDKKDHDLYEEFSARLKSDETLDTVFSRNRSFSKKIKRQRETEVNQGEGTEEVQVN